MNKIDIRAELLRILNEGVSIHPKSKNILFRYDLLDNLLVLFQSKGHDAYAKGYGEGLKMASQIYLTKTKGLSRCMQTNDLVSKTEKMDTKCGKPECLKNHDHLGRHWEELKVVCPKGDWKKRFDERFTTAIDINTKTKAVSNDIKAFIQDLLGKKIK